MFRSEEQGAELQPWHMHRTKGGRDLEGVTLIAQSAGLQLVHTGLCCMRVLSSGTIIDSESIWTVSQVLSC